MPVKCPSRKNESMTENKSSIFRFEDMEVREREFCLVRNGEVVAVEPKAFRVLLYLLQHPQKLISKEELLNAVWGDASVTENSLTQNIAKLRRLLEDDPREPRFIATVATVGYRLVCDVEVADEAPEDGESIAKQNGHGKTGLADASPNGVVNEMIAEFPPQSEFPPGPATSPRVLKRTASGRIQKLLFACAAVLAIGLGAAIWYLHRPLPAPRITGYAQITRDGRQKYLAGTDGNRLYMGSYSSVGLTEIGVSGGETAHLPVVVPALVDLLDVSSDGSNILVTANEDKNPSKIVWNFRTLGGWNRRIGEGRAASFSPDGTRIAYIDARGDVFVAGSDGSGIHKLVGMGSKSWNFSDNFENIVWSPDGKTLRFVNEGELWEIATDGSHLHRLLPGFNGLEGCGRWTADGHFFVFLAGNQIWALDERRGLLRETPFRAIRLEGSPIQWGPPIPARDGKTIFADGSIARGEILRLNAKTKKFEPFLGGISAKNVKFSRDGQSMIYVTYPDGILWRADKDGGHPFRLSDPPLNAFLPRWSPDGAHILFEDTSGPRSEIYLVSSGGGSPQRLFPDSKESMGDADWSADGSRIVFDVPPAWDPKAEIRIFDVKTNQVSTVPGSIRLFSPRWSPNGRYIVGLSSLDNKSLSLFDVNTQQWSKRLENFAVEFPEWSKDSRYIYFVGFPSNNGQGPEETGSQGLYRIRVGGGKPELVADLKGLTLANGGSEFGGIDFNDTPLIVRDTSIDDLYALTLEVK